MKALLVLLTFSMSGLYAMSQTKQTTEFKVYGNCGMCENRIEKAADIIGVEKAEWDKETKMIHISYDSAKVDLAQIHQKIADAGHDTELTSAKDEVYNKLPACCKYDRPEKPMGHDHKDGHKHDEGDHDNTK